jgi:hypothetical protein
MHKSGRPVKIAVSNYVALDFIPGLLIAAIIANHFLWIWHYAAQVPVADDYTLILNRLNIYNTLPSSLNLGYFLDFSGGQQHRLVFLTLVIVALYKVVGHIDFHALILVGNISLLIILWGMWKYAGSVLPISENRTGYFLPVALLVLSPAYFEASLWATGVLQNLSVLAFGFLAVAFAAQRSGFAFFSAVFAALLASGSSANGMSVFLACASVLTMQRRISRALPMVALFILVAWAYTRGFPKDLSNYGNSPTTSPWELIRFFLMLCGGIVWGKNGAAILGVLFVAGFGALTWQGLPKRNPVLWGFCLFLLLSMAMMSMGRAGIGLDAALVSRYKPYSGLMLVVIYLGLLIHVPSVKQKRIIGYFGFLLSCIIFVSYLAHYEAATTDFGLHSKLRMAYRAIEGKVRVSDGFPDTDMANQIIDTSERYGVYRPLSFSEYVVRPVNLNEANSPNQVRFDIRIYDFVDGEKAALVYGVTDENCAINSYRLELKSDEKSLIFGMLPPDFGWINSYPFRPALGHFGAIIDKRSLPAGTYQLGMSCGDAAPIPLGDRYRISKNL